LNYLDDAGLELLSREVGAAGCSVPVYCPRASEFFRHPVPGHPPHRYREMLTAGLPVALGTDSALVIGDSPTISVLDEMRFLWRRDGTDPMHLVAMATVHGARALGIDPALVRCPKAGARAARGVLVIHTGGKASAEVAGSAQARAMPILRSLLAGEQACSWLWR
jgi:imidazolonepropionase-like amidohydrolase